MPLIPTIPSSSSLAVAVDFGTSNVVVADNNLTTASLSLDVGSSDITLAFSSTCSSNVAVVSFDFISSMGTSITAVAVDVGPFNVAVANNTATTASLALDVDSSNITLALISTGPFNVALVDCSYDSLLAVAI